MKYSLALTSILVVAATPTIFGFAPTSSFTSFSVNRNKAGFYNDQHQLSLQRNLGNNKRGKRTEMKMMFDQLASALSEVAKNIGGRPR